MTIEAYSSGKKIKSIKQGDSNFYITDGMMTSGRAGYILSLDCPPEYIRIIDHAWQQGWLTPVAYMLESEYMWEKLGE